MMVAEVGTSSEKAPSSKISILVLTTCPCFNTSYDISEKLMERRCLQHILRDFIFLKTSPEIYRARRLERPRESSDK